MLGGDTGQIRVRNVGTRRGFSLRTLSESRTRSRGDTKRRGSAPPAGAWRSWPPDRMRDWGVTARVSRPAGIEPTDSPRRTSWRRMSKSRTPMSCSPGRPQLVNAGDQPSCALQRRRGTCYAIRRHLHPSRRASLGRHPRKRCRDLPVAPRPFLCARWSSASPPGSSESVSLVSRCGSRNGRIEIECLRRGLQPK